MKQINMDNLSFDEFTQLALRTESQITETTMDMPGFKVLLRMHTIIGTLLDYIKKGIFYNNYEKYDANFLKLTTELNELVLEFVVVCNKKRTPVTDLNFRLLHGLLGALTEASEIGEHLTKLVETGEVDKVGIGEEFSDSDWYKAITFDTLGLTEEVARRNVIEKLKKRFPDKYSDEKAANRDLDGERAILKQGIE